MKPRTPWLEAHASSPAQRRFLVAMLAIDRTSYYAIILAMGLMTLLVSAQVFARFVLSTSIDSADELSRLFFVWAIFLAIPHGIKIGIHVGIDAVASLFSKTFQRHLSRLMALASAVLMVILVWLSLGAVGDKWQQLMPTIPVTAAVFYIAVLISAGHSLLHLIAQIFEIEPLPSAPAAIKEGETS
jgi:TRAP-type C4-dicarboxylate transport system permease small subunit